MSGSIARRQALPHLIDEARAAVRTTRRIRDRFEFLSGHANNARERIDFASTSDQWDEELESVATRLAELERELAALEVAQ